LNQGLERGRDRFLSNLNGKLDRLWPEGDDGNGHDDKTKDYDYDKLARQLYEDHREHWYFHESSWYVRGVNGYDGQGCNQYTGCVPECVYDDGRLDLSELERIKNVIEHHADVKGIETETETEASEKSFDKTRLE
jgi:hypothetical protein